VDVLEPFMLRALAAGVGLAIVAAPLGCFVVWNRLAYFGETIAQASLLGVAFALAFQANITISVIAVAVLVALTLIALGVQRIVGFDSLLGLLHHVSLAAGIIAASLASGASIDLMGFLFGDVLAVTVEDLYWIFGGGAVVLAVITYFWQPLLRTAMNEDLAAAEGINPRQIRAIFTLLLALTIAVAMKIVGVLLVMAFLVVPAVAARPVAATPERMVVIAALLAALSVAGGLAASTWFDVPAGPAIVLAMAAFAVLTLLARGALSTRQV
jgi:zinc transport system permease protein